MKRMLISLAALSAASCATAPNLDLNHVRDAVIAAETAERDGWAARDIEAVMNAYTEDALIIAAGAPVRDKHAAREAFVRFMADPGFSLTFSSDPAIVAESGELAVATGIYSATFTNPQTNAIERFDGYHLLTWRRDSDGQWRIQRQLTAPSPR
ncbi:MAG: SgcJ/EcaC family oxidoreductase [Hyphomonadaceae bacterium]